MDVKNIFIKETSDNLAVLEQELVALVQPSKRALEIVIRTMHNIKGTAPMVGYNTLPIIAQPIEKAYNKALSSGEDIDLTMVDKTIHAVSILKDLLISEEAHTPQTKEEQKVLVDYFNSING